MFRFWPCLCKSALHDAVALDLADLNRVGYLLSAVLICFEYLRLGIVYRSQHIILLISFAIKSAFVVIEVGLSIGFGLMLKSHNPSQQNPGAILEWGMSFVRPPGRITANGLCSDCVYFHLLHPLVRGGLVPVGANETPRAARREATGDSPFAGECAASRVCSMKSPSRRCRGICMEILTGERTEF